MSETTLTAEEASEVADLVEAGVLVVVDLVDRFLAARLADRDAAGLETRVRALAVDLDEEVAERRADTKNIGPDDRQAFMHYTAGLSEVADRLRAVLSGPADEHPADGTGA